MNWNPTPNELREVERAHFRQTGRRGLTKARRALADTVLQEVLDAHDPACNNVFCSCYRFKAQT